MGFSVPDKDTLERIKKDVNRKKQNNLKKIQLFSFLADFSGVR
jgi:hypothetical protein